MAATTFVAHSTATFVLDEKDGGSLAAAHWVSGFPAVANTNATATTTLYRLSSRRV